jgi:hypothetical protein
LEIGRCSYVFVRKPPNGYGNVIPEPMRRPVISVAVCRVFVIPAVCTVLMLIAKKPFRWTKVGAEVHIVHESPYIGPYF